MWMRFTEQARKTVIAAQETAETAGAVEVQAHHLLSALLSGSGPGFDDCWSTTQLDGSRLGDALANRCTTGTGRSRPGCDLPFGEQAKLALQQAYSEARDLGHHEVGLRHLLVGTLATPDESVTSIVRELGIDLTEVRRRIADQGCPGEFGEEEVG